MVPKILDTWYFLHGTFKELINLIFRSLNTTTLAGMKKLTTLLSCLMAVLLFSQCTTTRTITTSEGSYDGIEVFTAKVPDKSFEEIKLIQVHGSYLTGPKTLMDRLIKQAKSAGADGLVNVQYNQLHVGSTISGTAVKFSSEN